MLRAVLLTPLSPRDAHVIELCFGLESGEPLEQADVAAQTGLSISTIKSIRAAALKQWRGIPGLHDILRTLLSDRPIRRALSPADGAAKVMSVSLKAQRKLTPAQIADIRHRRFNGETNRATGARVQGFPSHYHPCDQTKIFLCGIAERLTLILSILCTLFRPTPPRIEPEFWRNHAADRLTHINQVLDRMEARIDHFIHRSDADEPA